MGNIAREQGEIDAIIPPKNDAKSKTNCALPACRLDVKILYKLFI